MKRSTNRSKSCGWDYPGGITIDSVTGTKSVFLSVNSITTPVLQRKSISPGPVFQENPVVRLLKIRCFLFFVEPCTESSLYRFVMKDKALSLSPGISG